MFKGLHLSLGGGKGASWPQLGKPPGHPLSKLQSYLTVIRTVQEGPPVSSLKLCPHPSYHEEKGLFA